MDLRPGFLVVKHRNPSRGSSLVCGGPASRVICFFTAVVDLENTAAVVVALLNKARSVCNVRRSRDGSAEFLR